jgi:hypothetical protein
VMIRAGLRSPRWPPREAGFAGLSNGFGHCELRALRG